MKTFKPNVGMRFYADHTFSEKNEADKTLSGIVGYVEQNRALIVCLRSRECAWANHYFNVPSLKHETDGEQATKLIIKQAKKQSILTAAEWCYNYDFDGVKKGQAFLPSESEFLKVLQNRIDVDKALDSLPTDKIFQFGGYVKVSRLDRFNWTTEERNIFSVCPIDVEGRCIGLLDKKIGFGVYVRPMFWVKY